MARDRTIATQFRGLNVDRPVNRTPSGTARVALNTRRVDTVIGGRPGFDEWDATNTVGILQVVVFPDGAGDVWVGLKLADASLKVTAAYANSTGLPTAVSWSSLTLAAVSPAAGLSTTDPGWSFIFRDRMYVGDNVGGQKWHPTTTNKPGTTGTPSLECWIPGIVSNLGAELVAAAGGAKSGWYFVGAVLYNENDRSFSCIQDLQAVPVYTAFNDPDTPRGGMTVANWHLPGGGDIYPSHIDSYASNLKYEWTHFCPVCTLGTTDVRGGAASPSLRFWVEQEYARSGTTNPSLDLCDEGLGQRPRHDNGWGPPPLASHAYCNGDMAVYASTSADPGMVAISRGGFPCAVPGDQILSIGGVTTTWKAEPFYGFRAHAVEGIPTGIGWTGSRFIIWTSTGAYWVQRRGGDFTLIDSRATASCISHTGACSTADGAYAIGPGELNRASQKGVENLAFLRFASLLEEIPASCVLSSTIGNPQHKSVLAAYPTQQEVWLSVARTAIAGATEALRHDASASNAFSLYNTTDDGWSHARQFLPDAPADGDAIYFCFGATHPSLLDLRPNIDADFPAAYSSSSVIVWEFWNGSSWATLTDIYDLDNQTDTSGGRPFVTTTPYGGPPALPLSISNTPVPATWASTTVKGVAGYWIRARIATGKATSITSVPRGASAGINHVVGDTLVPCTAVVRERTAPSAGYFTVLDKAYEGTTYPYQFFPDTPADNDAAYFRMGTSAAPAFIALYVAIGRAAKYANAGVVVWEYYNGSTWVTLPGVTDGTNPDDATGGRPFIDDGIVGAASSADWASVSVSTFGAGYWIRCRIKVGQAASVTRVPILASEGPTRIYVYDELQNELVSYYDPRNLRGAYITAMHELALPTGNPRMLIGLSDGRTLSFPSENFYDTESTTLHLNYPTMQELYIGQEGRQLGKTITKLWTHVGALGGTLRMEVAGVATGTEDVDTEGMKGKDIVLADTVDESGPEFDPFLQGHFAKVRFSTTASDAASPEWEIIDLFVDMQG